MGKWQNMTVFYLEVFLLIWKCISYSFPYVPSIFPFPILAEASCHDPCPVLRAPAVAFSLHYSQS